MRKKRLIQIAVIAVVFCIVVGLAIRSVMLRQEEQRIEEARQMEQLQKQKEEAERMTQIQSDFDELVTFAYEYQDSIERLSVVSIEHMKDVMDIDNFDFDKACEVADIGTDAEIIREEFYMDISAIKYSIEWQSEYTEMPPEVAYIYRKGILRMLNVLIYFYTDTPEETWEYYGSGNDFDGYEQISEHLYAVWSIPRYT